MIYTSHSPYFVDLHRFDSVRIVRKRRSVEGRPPFSVVAAYSLADAAATLANAYGGMPSEYTAESFYARAMPIMNVVVNEGFFADCVVVVEGLSEVGALWRLQEILNSNWLERGIVPIPAGGKNNIDRPVVIFRGLGIATYYLFDADEHQKGTARRQEAAARNRRYLGLSGVPVEDFPGTRVEDGWACLSTNLEGVIKDSVGAEPVQKATAETAASLCCDCGDRAWKNMEGVAHIVGRLYNAGLRVPTLERIVQRVTDLSARSSLGPLGDPALPAQTR